MSRAVPWSPPESTFVYHLPRYVLAGATGVCHETSLLMPGAIRVAIDSLIATIARTISDCDNSPSMVDTAETQSRITVTGFENCRNKRRNPVECLTPICLGAR